MARTRLSLRGRLIVGSSCLALLPVASCVFGLLSTQRLSSSFEGLLDKTIAAADLAQEAASSTQHASELRRQFLIERDPALMETLQAEITGAQDAIARIGEIKGDAVASDIQAVDASLAQLSEANRELLNAYTVRGLSHKEGMEGTLRAAVHALETDLKEDSLDNLTVLMLMSRRHENDFLLRGDRKYLDRVDLRLAEFEVAAAAYGFEQEKLDRWGGLWKTYRDSLAALVDATESLNNWAQQADEYSESTLAAVDGLRSMLDGEVRGARAAAASVSSSASFGLFLLLGLAVVSAAGVTVWIVRGVVSSVRSVSRRAELIAQGDLTGDPVPVRSSDELGTLAKAVNSMRDSLTELVRGISETASGVSDMSKQIVRSSNETAQNIREQETQANQVSASVTEMTSSIDEVAASSDNVASGAADAGDRARAGAEVVGKTVEEMRQIADQVATMSGLVDSLGQQSQQIGDVVEVINDIADQTNLLALNAAIEAARAGEHGRGFAVVADEVRKLADRTTKATAEVSGSIESIQRETGRAVEEMNSSTERVSAGVGLAEQAGESLEAITSGSTEVSAMVQFIAAAAREQASAAGEISRSIESIRATTEQSSSGATESANAASKLSAQADELLHAVERFTID